MIQLKIKHPCYAGKEYCVVYAENDKKVRYNIKQKEQDGEYSCCVCLYKENILDDFIATETITDNPQKIE